MKLSPVAPMGANPERARSHNRQLVLGAVRAAGAVGRAEIARASGLSTQAVSNIIADLMDEGLLCEQGRVAAGRGMPVVQYALQPGGRYGLGVEVRPDAVLSALVDLVGTPVYTHRAALPDRSRGAVLAAVRAAFDRALAETGLDRSVVLGSGIAMPGPFGETGVTGTASDLPGWHDADPARAFEAVLDLPVLVENDANAAAMAERMSGVATGLGSYAYLYFGQGLGLGLVQDGQLVRGAFGNAGEIGHIPVPLRGTSVILETQVSRMSAEQHLARAGIAVSGIDDLDRLFRAGTPALQAWLHLAAEALSPALAIVENLFDPEAVILGGAMPAAVLDALVAAVDLPARSVANRTGRIAPRLIRGTCGRMTATLGAAALVLNQTFTPAIATR